MKLTNIGTAGANIMHLDLGALDLTSMPLDFVPGDYVDTSFEPGLPVQHFVEIPNEFLATLNENQSRILATGMLKMLHAIAVAGTDFHAADVLVEELTDELTKLVQDSELKLMDNLYEFTEKYIEKDDEDDGEPQSKVCFFTEQRRMLAATIFLGKLFSMVIQDFLNHFDELKENEVLLYPAFENAIRNSGKRGLGFIARLRDVVGTLAAHKDPKGIIPNAITRLLAIMCIRRVVYYKLDDPNDYLRFLLVTGVMNDIDRELSRINDNKAA